MINTKRPFVVPLRAQLATIEIVGDLDKANANKQPDHFVVVAVDDVDIAKSEMKVRSLSLRWEWPKPTPFLFEPSSTIKITVYRESRTRIMKYPLGQYIGKVIDLIENEGIIDLEDTHTRATMKLKFKVAMTLTCELEDGFERLMDTVDTEVLRLDESVKLPAGVLALQNALRLTKNIMDIVADVHPILKVSWTIMSAVYGAVEQAQLVDDNVRDLAESLRELLGTAKECPDLPVIKGTTNVIEEIGRMSLKVTSLIHEYTRPNFIRRTLNSQLSDDMRSRIKQCQASCDKLKEKFNQRLRMGTNNAVNNIQNIIIKDDANIQNILRTIKDEQLSEQIYQWLSAPDSSQNYNEAREKYLQGTCTWFLNGSRFRGMEEKADFVWINGSAGCGKTILCSSIIARIIELRKQNASITYAYFFFDGRDSQRDLQLHDKLIRSLIVQLSLQCNGIPATLVDLYGHGHHHQPSTKSLEDTLHRIVDGLNSTYIVIDSLDECIEREKTLPWIEHTVSRRMDNLRMVVVCRPEQDIREVLPQLDSDPVDLTACENPDIEIFLSHHLSRVKKWDEETRTIVKSKLTAGAQGMFRWVALQLMELKKCSNQHSVLRQLESLPKGLNETYDRMLLKIEKRNDRTDTKTFLRWLCYAVRPMKLAEIAESITIDFELENEPRYLPSHKYWDERDVLGKCSGFVVESEGLVKLAHFSIKEYLLSDYLRSGPISSFHLVSEELSHSVIAQTCVTYLLEFDTPQRLDQRTGTDSFPLARYAAKYWIVHAKSGGIDKPDPSLLLTLAEKLLTTKATFMNWIRTWDLDRPNFIYTPNFLSDLRDGDVGTPLYYASLGGLQQVSRYLLEVEKVNVNARGGEYNTALQAASIGGHEKIVQLLLSHQADVNAQGGEYGNALEAASARGSVVIVKLLLQSGANVNTSGGKYGNALQAATNGGHEGITKLLLERRADLDAHGGKFDNALYAASNKGHDEVVELLINSGASVNMRGGRFDNALQAALLAGHTTTVELLLANGAVVRASDELLGTGLYSAAERGQEMIAKLLLQSGADLNIKRGWYGNALQAASVKGHAEIVELLLKNGVDVNAEGGEFSHALYAASKAGHLEIAKKLLEWHAKVNARGGYYGNALQVAAHSGHLALVQLLLQNGADVNAQGGFYGNALQAAADKGDEAIVELLLQYKANVNAQGGEFGSALAAASYWANDMVVNIHTKPGTIQSEDVQDLPNRTFQAETYKGHNKIVKLLCEKGADANAIGKELGNTLQVASRHGREDIVKRLIDKGADLEAQPDTIHGTALCSASNLGHEEIVKVLLNAKSDPNTQGGLYGNALQAASYSGHIAIVKILIAHKANVNAQGGKYGSALQAASCKGHEAIVNLLLENGASVNAQGGEYSNALQAAFIHGYDKIVKRLRGSGANSPA